MELLFFYIFAGVAIGSAVMVVTNKNVLHAALFLILTFFCVSAIYVILRAEFLAAIRDPTFPQAYVSWYGPLGLIAFVTAVALLVLAIRRGSVRRGTLVLALAPLVTLVVVAAVWAYSPWHGRFLMPAVALSAATWGVLHRVRPLSWALSAIALVTLLLSFLHYVEKPAGISLLEGTTSRSVWTASRETVIHA